MKQICWISYDLGVKGDYEGLYAWLDNCGAQECGNNVATLKYEYRTDFIEDIKKDIESCVDLSKHDRIYVIWREDGRMKGIFIHGTRKASPWSGYGIHEPNVDEEDV